MDTRDTCDAIDFSEIEIISNTYDQYTTVPYSVYLNDLDAHPFTNIDYNLSIYTDLRDTFPVYQVIPSDSDFKYKDIIFYSLKRSSENVVHGMNKKITWIAEYYLQMGFLLLIGHVIDHSTGYIMSVQGGSSAIDHEYNERRLDGYVSGMYDKKYYSLDEIITIINRRDVSEIMHLGN